jgi:hypothetical protein
MGSQVYVLDFKPAAKPQLEAGRTNQAVIP